MYITLSSGGYYTFGQEEDLDVTIDDIARSLSMIARFNGHVSKFYSVAQHSVLLSRLAPDDLKMAALLHDASEAYLGDIVAPLKEYFRANSNNVFFELEEKLEKHIMSHLSKTHNSTKIDYEKIKEFHETGLDKEIVKLESLLLQTNSKWAEGTKFSWGNSTELSDSITNSWHQEKAEQEFKKRFLELL